MKLMPLGVENLVLVSDETRKQVYEAARRPPDVTPKQQQDGTDGPSTGAKKEKQWRVGGVEFEALMRMLDNAVSITLTIHISAVWESQYNLDIPMILFLCTFHLFLFLLNIRTSFK